ncbi:MAG: hypothetical protein M1339_05635 [Bacteroidetes bacterium]|nr:hypothetical protein [Bacteroidota bacterium]
MFKMSLFDEGITVIARLSACTMAPKCFGAEARQMAQADGLLYGFSVSS